MLDWLIILKNRTISRADSLIRIYIGKISIFKPDPAISITDYSEERRRDTAHRYALRDFCSTWL